MSGKYYAVARGFTVGIFPDWPSAKKATSGYPGAIFKSFKDLSGAQEFLAANQPQSSINSTVIYTDGSYSADECGFGVVIETTPEMVAFGRIALEGASGTNNLAELYAIYIALTLVDGDVIINSDSQYSIGVLTYYSSQNPQAPNYQLISQIKSQMVGRQVEFRYVKAHAGHLQNHKADRLANQGRLQSQALMIYQGDQILTLKID